MGPKDTVYFGTPPTGTDIGWKRMERILQEHLNYFEWRTTIRVHWIFHVKSNFRRSDGLSKKIAHHGVVLAGGFHAGAGLLLHELEGAGLAGPVVQVLSVPGPESLAAGHAALGPLGPLRGAAADVPAKNKKRF